MNIAVIGTGNIGSTLASKWVEKGHRIFLGVRDTNNFKGQALVQNDLISAHPIAEAVAHSDVILIATPPEIAPNLAKQMGNTHGKVIIDATNSVRTKPAPYETAYHALAELTEADVVKCFNTTGFENMANPNYDGHAIDLFMAGDSDRAKAVAHALAMDVGFDNCYDFGQGAQVVLLEQLAISWINLAIFQQMGRNIGFKLLHR
ncbi:MAG: NAD(P)-binding domain-containing protein [Bacteroidota bacterium]